MIGVVFGGIVMLLPAGCTDEGDQADAYGNFEANPTVVSSESAGRLLAFRADDGERLAGGEIVGVVDTTQLVLRREALRAQRRAAASRIESIRARLEVLAERRRIAADERDRFESLVRLDAAPQKKVDDLSDQIDVLKREMAAVRTEIGTVRSEVESIDAQVAQVSDQIERSAVVNPLDGVVLAAYAEPYEMAAPGMPLYEIADLDTLDLKAYVSGGQLPQLKIGEQVDVLVDRSAEEVRVLPGTVSWIASEAEFTPKLIQTREERVNLVYAFTVRVPNPDGLLKIGMPGEVRFSKGR